MTTLPSTLILDPKTAIAFCFHGCRNCKRIPVVRTNDRGWLAFCNFRSCDKWPKVEAKTLAECWELWEAL
jgi:hypothetical protein